MIIYTLTPNPALDLSGQVKSLVPNEKNYVFEERRDPGGNGINSSRIIHRLGQRTGHGHAARPRSTIETTALGFLGGSTGREICELLEAEGLRHAFTPIQGHTRVNVTVNNHATHQQTRLTFPGPKISARERQALMKKIRSLRAPGLLLIGGSVPPGCGETFHRQVVAAACAQGLGVFLDVPGRYIASALKSRHELLLAKPNTTELEEWRGRKLSTDSARIAAARALSEEVALVCISLAERGTLLVTRHGAWIARAPKIRARGTVGAGDSMVGAMAVALARAGVTTPAQVHAQFQAAPTGELPSDIHDMLRWGVAAGAATAQSVGTHLGEAREIRRLFPRVRVSSQHFGPHLA